MCLVAFWCKHEKVSTACADLTFDIRELDVGSKQVTATPRLVNNEDKFRTGMGIRSWRKVGMYHDIANMVVAEGRFNENGAD